MPTRSAKTADLFGAPSLPEGFRTAPALFSAAEEKAFIRAFENLPFKPFEFHGYLGNRRIVSYGFRYDYGGRALRCSKRWWRFPLPRPAPCGCGARQPRAGNGPMHWWSNAPAISSPARYGRNG